MNGTGDRHPPALLMDNPLRGIVERRTRFDHLLREGDVAADLGCGSGYYTLHFAGRVGPKGLVYGVDNNIQAVKALERKVAKKGMTNVRTWTGSSADLSFIPDASVDFVLSNLTLCCMMDHGPAVDEMERIMKTGAKAYISITTIGRRGDPRRVGREEFGTITRRFRVLDNRKGWAVSAALVQKK